MRIEILFPEFCNLFGESGNVRFLKKCLPEAEFIETSFIDTPAFAENDVDMIYMGPMSESAQLKIIAKLMPLRDRIADLIRSDKVMLFIGNACEVFCKAIETPDGIKEGLGILPYTAKQEMIKRFNGLTMGKMDELTLLGFRSQFTFGYGDNSKNAFCKVKRGIGLNPETKYEGFRAHNMFATYLLGPILVVNPDFTHYLLQLLQADRPLPFEEELQKAYQIRLAEFKDPKTEF